MTRAKEEVIKLLVTPNDFNSWLKEKEPSAVVGRSGDATSCPIACFLKDAGAVAYVHPDHVAVYTPQDLNFYEYILYEKDIGSWVVQFIYTIDDAFRGDITANSALEVLNNLKEEEFDSWRLTRD